MIRRELGVFLIVGSLTVVIDFLCYRTVAWSGVVSVGTAKAAGFLIGTAFAYFANRAWTFGRREHVPGTAWRFVLLYGVSLGANVAVNAAVLGLAAGNAYLAPYAVPFAFLMATGVSTCLNFLGMKLFVFRALSHPEAS